MKSLVFITAIFMSSFAYGHSGSSAQKSSCGDGYAKSSSTTEADQQQTKVSQTRAKKWSTERPL